jgi:hypothetical protein
MEAPDGGPNFASIKRSRTRSRWWPRRTIIGWSTAKSVRCPLPAAPVDLGCTPGKGFTHVHDCQSRLGD